jgi:hypothetical protein
VTGGFPKLAMLLFQLIERVYDSLLWLAMKLALFVPRRLAPPVRYRYRYWKRSRQEHTSLPMHEPHLWLIDPSSDKRDSLEISSRRLANIRNTVVLQNLPPQVLLPAPLLRLISCQGSDAILLQIIFFLHYTNVINLAL